MSQPKVHPQLTNGIRANEQKYPSMSGATSGAIGPKNGRISSSAAAAAAAAASSSLFSKPNKSSPADQQSRPMQLPSLTSPVQSSTPTGATNGNN